MRDLLDIPNRKIEAERDKLIEALPIAFAKAKSEQNKVGVLPKLFMGVAKVIPESAAA